METSSLFVYLLKVSVSLAILWGLWYLFLRKVNRFSLIRLFLLLGVVISAGMPILLSYFTFDFMTSVPDAGGIYAFRLPEVTVGVALGEGSGGGRNILLMAFVTISSLLFVRFIVQLIRIGLLMRKGQMRKVEGLYIVEHPKRISPFSFMNFCFINPNDIAADKLEGIVAHERAHSHLWHSMDIVFMELMALIQWFNPFYWMIRRALVEVHEYQADQAAIKSQNDPYAYLDTIVSVAFGGVALSIGNNFSKSLTLKRLAMMNVKEITKGALGRWVLAVFIALPLIFIVACNEQSALLDDEFIDNSNASKSSNQYTEEDVFVIVEQMPGFQGRDSDAFREFLAQNLKYPEIAAENGIQGRVWVRFVVEPNGELSSVSVVRGVDPILDKEAIRVVESSPKWEPGKQRGVAVRVSFTFPINFVLDDSRVDKKSVILL